MIQWLINRAKRTPYFHLDGYMNRWWLVPYNAAVLRSVEVVGADPDPASLPTDAACSYSGVPGAWTKREIVYQDGTGPVTWRRPIAKILQRLGIAVRIHEILRSDDARDPHDHPWPFVTIILRGGYFEIRYDEQSNAKSMKWHGPGSVLFRRAADWHRLILPAGETATTLFITGKYTHSWGFNVAGTKVPNREYTGANQ